MADFYAKAAPQASAGGGAAITSINADTTAAQTLTTGTTGTDFAIVDNGTGDHKFNLPSASAVNRGALLAADWSTFNGKQAAGNYITALTGGVTASGPGSAAATVVTNANLTGPITSVGNATSIASQTGTGSVFVVQNTPTLTTPNIGAATGTSLSVSGSLTSTVATGTAPLVVSSTTQVANLNAATAGSATTATTATNATNTAITDDTTTNATMFPTWVTTTTGNLPQKVSSSKLSFNPSTGALTATTFIGALTGTASGNLTATANQFGVLLSGAANAAVVLAPDASTTKVLTSGGAGANPTWSAVPVAPLSVASKTAAYTTVSTDNFIKFDMSGSSNASYAVTLHTAVGNSGQVLYFEITAGTGTLSVNTTSSQTVGTLNSGVWAFVGVTNSMSVVSDGTNWQILKAPYIAPKVTVYTSGTSTFTTQVGPTQIPTKAIRVRMSGAGGGGGGGGSGASTPGGAGGNGGNSTFGSSLLTANGGSGAAFQSTNGAGGTATVATVTQVLALTGGNGSAWGYTGNTGTGLAGGTGGTNPLGGAGGSGSQNNAGDAGKSNTGAGGGGGGTYNTVSASPGAGGGAGGFLEAWIFNPASIAATFSAVVGSGGSAGSAGSGSTAGGAGASGIIICEEHF